MDVATAAGLRLSEFTFHTWDVEVAFDPAAVLASDATGPLLDQAGMLIGFLGKADALEGRAVRLAVRTTAPERSFGLDLGEAVGLGDEPAEPDAVLSAPAEWWLRLTTGRHAPAYTPANVTLTGDALTLDDLRRVFPGFSGGRGFGIGLRVLPPVLPRVLPGGGPSFPQARLRAEPAPVM
ncbi:hypothetical protein [Streptomyces acidicola]|uniref:Uncharacterized protein n=1 Tax=Streptomyces acidicola TaxID=2596892 RepID=A0A5N8X376_9ACTN|nr:hypothetical protein [Streptomyces acidicola]MPY53752.1 hypothetical protein [Streptomyces acidicola]